MSAIVCGKRSFFEEIHHTPPPVTSKRLRCSSSPIRLSPPRAHFSPSSPASPPPSPTLFAHLVSLFPDMDKQLIERALQVNGNDLDSAIKSLNELCLGSIEGSGDGCKADVGTVINTSLQSEEAACPVSSFTSAPENALPMDGSEWVELFVREMMSASDIDDARARASRVLEVLEKSILDQAGVEATENLKKENAMLKEHVESLLRENNILKRAVAIQHERQKEYDEKNNELKNLKQLLSQYQEQLRTLEVNNYALAMHLKQAQQSNSFPNRFHPDVF